MHNDTATEAPARPNRDSSIVRIQHPLLWLRCVLTGGIAFLVAAWLLQRGVIVGMPRRIYTYDGTRPDIGWDAFPFIIPTGLALLGGLAYGVVYAWLLSQRPRPASLVTRTKYGVVAGIAAASVVLVAYGLSGGARDWLAVVAGAAFPSGAILGALSGVLMPRGPAAASAGPRSSSEPRSAT